MWTFFTKTNDRPSASTGLAETDGDGEELGDDELLGVGLAGAGESLAAVELPFAQAPPKTESAMRRAMDRADVFTCEA